MSKVKLSGLDIAVKELDNTIKIKKEDSSNGKEDNIRIDIINKEGNIIDGLSTENLIKGLIVCSNTFLPENEPLENVKKYKCRLEKLIKKGAIVKVDMLSKEHDIMRLTIHIKGRDKYNFYSPTLMEAVKFTEEYKTVLKTEL